MAGATKDRGLIETQRALLTLYSASSSDLKMRVRAGSPAATIGQPSLTLFGTAIPQHFFTALSEQMLTNGLAGRMLVIDASGPRVGQRASIVELPKRIIETAERWRDFTPYDKGLSILHPTPKVIPYDRKANALLQDFRTECDELYNAAGDDGEAERTIHARTCEMARKLALLYAVSEQREGATISEMAARWATGFAQQQAKQTLAMVERYGANSPFEKDCRRILEFLRSANGHRLQRSDLLRKMKLPAKQFNELAMTLQEREDISMDIVPTAGRPAAFFRLR